MLRNHSLGGEYDALRGRNRGNRGEMHDPRYRDAAAIARGVTPPPSPSNEIFKWNDYIVT